MGQAGPKHRLPRGRLSMVHARRSCRSNWRDIALEPAGAPALLLAARATTAPSLDLRPAAKLANSSPLCGKSQQVDHLPPVRREKSRHPQFSVELIKVESISKENRRASSGLRSSRTRVKDEHGTITNPRPAGERRGDSCATVARQSSAPRSGFERTRPDQGPYVASPDSRSTKRLPTQEAEGEGFEPSIRLTTDNGFRDRRIRPLCHPSARARRSRRGVTLTEKEGFEPSMEPFSPITP